ncbi:MAG TPA: hypothetical protein DCR93_11760, partial [Cytophagales bacterium]|nr:hypothetical protein [Cytophagales bacterium]
STALGSYPVGLRGGNSFGATLPLQPEGGATAEVLYTADADADPVVVGLLNVLAYAQEKRTVHVVPVGTTAFAYGQALQDSLNRIYRQRVTEWTVITEQPWDDFGWDENGDGAVNLEESVLLTAYPPELKKLTRRYIAQHFPNRSHYYLFLVPLASGEGNLAGYMPRKRDFGFVFTNQTGDNSRTFYNTAAHELGHGAFRFDHWWSETGQAQGSTPNLMDYGG